MVTSLFVVFPAEAHMRNIEFSNHKVDVKLYQCLTVTNFSSKKAHINWISKKFQISEIPAMKEEATELRWSAPSTSLSCPSQP
jgi:hypothetical protein